MLYRILLCFLLLTIGFTPTVSRAADDAPYIVILHYKDIGGEPGNSVSLAHFKNHLETLQKDNRKVMSMHLASNFLKKAKPGEVGYILSIENLTPENFPSVFGAAKEAGMSFVAFLDTSAWMNETGQKYLKGTEQSGHAVYGLTTSGLIRDEDNLQAGLNKAVSDYRSVFSTAPNYFLFSEGVFNAPMMDVVKNHNFDVILGGAQGMVTASDKVWPRYDVTVQNAEPERFRELLDIKPLHVSDKMPTVSLLEDSKPKIGFTVKDKIDDKENLRCFLQGKGAQNVTFLSDERVEVRPELEQGRKHYMNCILRTEQKGGKFSYRWLGFLLQVPAPEIVEEPEMPEAEIALEEGVGEEGEEAGEDTSSEEEANLSDEPPAPQE